MTSVLVVTLVFVISLAFICRVLLRLHRACRMDEVTRDWLVNFSATPYFPMQALLDREDFAFLSRQPGFDLGLYKKLRRERLRIFRQYLNRLIADFNRLHAGARMSLAEAQGDHSDLLANLIKLRLRFSLAVFRAEGSYLLCCLGCRTLAVRSLIQRLEEMTAQTSAILAMPPATALG